MLACWWPLLELSLVMEDPAAQFVPEFLVRQPLPGPLWAPREDV